MEKRTALEQAVQIAGGQVALASALTALNLKHPNGRSMKFKQGHVWSWLKRGWPPAEVCIGIESITEARVTRYDLLPEAFAQSPRKISA